MERRSMMRSRRKRRSARRSKPAPPPPTTCPQCNYDWRGLPDDHACPECGMARDEHLVIVRSAGVRGFVAPGILVALLLGCFAFRIGGLAVGFLHALGTVVGGAILGMVAVALLVIIVPNRTRMHGRRSFAAITPAGIQTRIGVTESLVPWNEFRYLEIRRFSPCIYAERRDARGKIEPYRVELPFLFGSRGRYDAFDQAVEDAQNRRLRERASDHPESTH